MIKVHDTEIAGVKVIEPGVFKDDRGFFFESYVHEKYSGFGINESFVQDNFSKSIKNTIRGLHYQVGEFAQGKLCQVISGAVLDVAIDVRHGSPTFGRFFAIELNDENHFQLWIPAGFAHGFAVLSETAVFHYKCTAVYSKKDERTIRYDDPDINIKWPITNPLVSEKDLAASSFKEIGKDFIYNI